MSKKSPDIDTTYRSKPWLLSTALTNLGSALYWQLVWWAIILITKLQFENEYFQAIVHSVALLAFNATLVLGTRYIIFEVVYGDEPYCTPRKQVDHEDMFNYPYEKIWFTIAFVGLYNFPLEILDFDMITLKEHAQLCFLWLWTDVWFTCYHAMNHRFFYGPNTWLHHKEHHTFASPTSLQPVDHFTTIDGSGHVLMYLCAAFVTETFWFHLDQKMFVLAMFQWMVAGQIHHGGKDIDANIVCGLEYVRRLLGFHVHMAKLHDIHHTDTHYNYGMTGLFDYFAMGTYREQSNYDRRETKKTNMKKTFSTTYDPSTID